MRNIYDEVYMETTNDWYWNMILMIDRSGSMGLIANNSCKKTGTVNRFVDSFLSELIDFTPEYNIITEVRILAFNESAEWMVGSKEGGKSLQTAYKQWEEVFPSINPCGSANTAKAINKVIEALTIDRNKISEKKTGKYTVPPAILLFSDGTSSEPAEKTLPAIERMCQIWSRRTIRIFVTPDPYNDQDSIVKRFASVGFLCSENIFRKRSFSFSIDDASTVSPITGKSLADCLISYLGRNCVGFPDPTEWE